MRLILRVNKITLWMNMTSRERLRVIQVDLKIKASMQANDQAFQELQKCRKKVVLRKFDF